MKYISTALLAAIVSVNAYSQDESKEVKNLEQPLRMSDINSLIEQGHFDRAIQERINFLLKEHAKAYTRKTLARDGQAKQVERKANNQKQRKNLERGVPQVAYENEDIKVIPIGDQEPVFGEKDSKYTLVLYTDETCEDCTKHIKEALKTVEGLNNYSMAVRFFPTEGINSSSVQRMSEALCVLESKGQEEYWEYLTSRGYNVEIDENTCTSSTEKIYKSSLQAKQDGIVTAPTLILINNETQEQSKLQSVSMTSLSKKILEVSANEA